MDHRDVEDLSGDVTVADVYVAVFPHEGLVGVLASVPMHKKVQDMKRFVNVLETFGFADSVTSFGIRPHITRPGVSGVTEITFLTEEDHIYDRLSLFLEYARQARALMNPIVCDIRKRKFTG